MQRRFWRLLAYILNMSSLCLSILIFSNLLRGREVDTGVQLSLAAGSIGVQFSFLAIIIMSRNSQ